MLIKELDFIDEIDEKRVPRLDDWVIYHGPIPVAAGVIYDHPRFADGTNVTTSRIRNDSSPLYLETLNTFYVLGARRT